MEWISVKDRLPEEGKIVMWFNGEDVWTGHIKQKEKGLWFYVDNGWVCCWGPDQDDYKYWMPLPEPPKQKE